MKIECHTVTDDIFVQTLLPKDLYRPNALGLDEDDVKELQGCCRTEGLEIVGIFHIDVLAGVVVARFIGDKFHIRAAYFHPAYKGLEKHVRAVEKKRFPQPRCDR